MNTKQKIILWIGIVIIVVMGLFPPWVHRGGPGVEKTAGYSFILSEPERFEMGWFPRPDISRLFIQWIIVAFITAGLIVTVKDKKIGKTEKKVTCSSCERNNRCTSEIKIIRFVDISACRSIFSEKSTFVLRSPIYYQRMYEISGGKEGDKKEGRPDTAKGTSEFIRWVVSCWTILKGNEPTDKEWGIFKEDKRNVVAIISTPSKVCEFLNKNLRGLPFHQVEHRGVEYDKEKVKVDHTNFPSAVPFAKGKQFTEENEYRFALTYGWGPQLIDSFIFCGGIDYMEKCYVNPEISKEENKKEKAELQLIVQRAGSYYGDFYDKKPYQIIANADIIF